MSSRDLAAALRDALRDETPPVPVRALVAAVLMCARGGAPSRLGMSKLARYSYGSSQNNYADLLDALVERIPHVVGEMVPADSVDPAAAAKLRDDLQQRDATIARLRTELADLKERHEHVRRYTLALHQQQDERDMKDSETGGRIVPLRRLDI